MRIGISSGHSDYSTGAVGFLNELKENRRVTNDLVRIINNTSNIVAVGIHDYKGVTVSQNVNNLINGHINAKTDWDIQIHFNAGGGTGVEAYISTINQSTTRQRADILCTTIAKSLQLDNRGTKIRQQNGVGTIGFLESRYTKNAILLEICFVDNKLSSSNYNKYYNTMINNLADAIIKIAGGNKNKPNPSLVINHYDTTPTIQNEVLNFLEKSYKSNKISKIYYDKFLKNELTTDQILEIITTIIIHDATKSKIIDTKWYDKIKKGKMGKIEQVLMLGLIKNRQY